MTGSECYFDDQNLVSDRNSRKFLCLLKCRFNPQDELDNFSVHVIDEIFEKFSELDQSDPSKTEQNWHMHTVLTSSTHRSESKYCSCKLFEYDGTVNCIKTIPLHSSTSRHRFVGSPSYPILHEQSYEPSLFVQSLLMTHA